MQHHDPAGTKSQHTLQALQHTGTWAAQRKQLGPQVQAHQSQTFRQGDSNHHRKERPKWTECWKHVVFSVLGAVGKAQQGTFQSSQSPGQVSEAAHAWYAKQPVPKAVHHVSRHYALDFQETAMESDSGQATMTDRHAGAQ
jgi:hypothetical protein